MKCVKCGKEAKYFSRIYISPLCKECALSEVIKIWAKENPNNIAHSEVDDFYIKLSDNIATEIKEERIDLGEEY